MRIGFIVNNYPPHLGGLELHVQSLARQLTRFGHEVAVITLDHSDELAAKPTPLNDFHQQPFADQAVRVLRVPKKLNIGDVFSLPTFKSIRTIIRAVRQANLDVISVHTRFFPLTWLGVAIGAKLHMPVILTEHGSDFVSHNSASITAAAKAVDLTLGRWSHRHATKVLGVSTAVTSFVKKLSDIDATVFFNAVAPPDLALNRHAATHLVFIGRLVYGKGWGEFIRIASELKAQMPEISATIVGGGPDEPAVRAAAPDWMRVTGRIAQDEAIALLAGSTLINPTVLSEGFQTTVVEAITNGGRVVGYPEPASEALRDAGAPVTLVAQGDEAALLAAVREALLHPKAPFSSAESAEWTWPQRAREYEATCVAVLSQHK